MNRREAKREATLLLAEHARDSAGLIARLIQRGRIRRGDLTNTRRVEVALTELAEELTRRVTREPKPVAPIIDPGQGSLLTECCNGTGYADYAAIPCSAPGCPAAAALTQEMRRESDADQ